MEPTENDLNIEEHTHSVEYSCEAVIRSISSKADRNKRRAHITTLAFLGITTTIPIFIGLSGDHFLLAKLVPSVLAVASIVLLGWVELKRPHEKWKLYRRYQRLLEAELLHYRFGSEPYDSSKKADELLAHRVAELELSLQEEWEGLVPTTGSKA